VITAKGGKKPDEEKAYRPKQCPWIVHSLKLKPNFRKKDPTGMPCHIDTLKTQDPMYIETDSCIHNIYGYNPS